MELADARNRSDGVQTFGAHLLRVVPLANGKDQLFRMIQCRLDRSDRSRPTGADRSRHSRKEDDLAQGQDRQRQSFTHFRFNLSMLLLTSCARVEATLIVEEFGEDEASRMPDFAFALISFKHKDLSEIAKPAREQCRSPSALAPAFEHPVYAKLAEHRGPSGAAKLWF
jgi:hypothetical protein